jgi:4-aminobutyrate aminotransferase
VLEFTPPLVLTRADAERGVELLDEALTEVESGRFPDERLGPYVGW